MPDPLAPLGKYQPLAQIGAGGFAVVYRARDTVLEREVALKVLKPQFLSDSEFVERFFREARTVAALDHPAIVKIFDVASSHGRAYIAMELATDSLSDRLSRQGALPWAEALALLRPLCEALDYAHELGLIHRDIKPANILLSRRGLPLFSDFGFARASAEGSVSMSMSGGVLGTPGYIAPEIWDGGQGGSPADRYALACVAYELLTGAVLFQADTPARAVRAHVVDGPRFPAQWPPGVPLGTSAVLARALHREPEGRFPDAMAFWDTLNALKDQPRPPVPTAPEPVTPPPPVVPQPGPFAPLQGRPGCTLVVTLALLLAVGGFGSLFLGSFVPDALTPTVVQATGFVQTSVVVQPSATPSSAPTATSIATAPATATPTATIAPSPTPGWTAEPAELGQLLPGGGEGELFVAASRDKALIPDILPDTPSCIEGRVVGADGAPLRQFRVELLKGSEVRRADHDFLTGTYAICALEPGDWEVRIANYLRYPTPPEEQAAHAVRFHASGAPGEIFYIVFQARAPLPAPAVPLFPPLVPSPRPPERYDGRWEGRLSGSAPTGPVSGFFAFRVREGKLVFTESSGIACPWGDPDLRADIADGFSFAGLAIGAAVYYELAAAFSSPTEAQGTLVADHAGTPCISGATWTARRTGD